MVIIHSHNIISIICKTLNCVDNRLINHGERVAYIVLKMLRQQNKLEEKEIQEICVLSLLHDIGAYKTNEIDKLVEFETSDVWEHAVYGSLFLKSFSPLAHLSDAILYHHLPYNKAYKINAEHMDIAMMISLADRLDIYTQSSNFTLGEKSCTAFKAGMFSPDALELFYSANEQYDIIEHIKDGTYLDELRDYFGTFSFSEKVKSDYLIMLALMIDFRSRATVLHTIITVNISMELVRYMGIDENWSKAVYYGALLHDLGKISTPLFILENTGKLNFAEMEVMQLHVSMTEAIIKDYINKDICDISVRHHEKLDGTGYPYGLTGDQLTPCQRALAVADILSALIGERSYKKPFSKEYTLGILQKMADDGKICRAVTGIVTANYDEIMQNVNEKGLSILKVYDSISREYPLLVEECLAI